MWPPLIGLAETTIPQLGRSQFALASVAILYHVSGAESTSGPSVIEESSES